MGELKERFDKKLAEIRAKQPKAKPDNAKRNLERKLKRVEKKKIRKEKKPGLAAKGEANVKKFQKKTKEKKEVEVKTESTSSADNKIVFSKLELQDRNWTQGN